MLINLTCLHIQFSINCKQQFSIQSEHAVRSPLVILIDSVDDHMGRFVVEQRGVRCGISMTFPLQCGPIWYVGHLATHTHIRTQIHFITIIVWCHCNKEIYITLLQFVKRR
jgi:hypothetical protein